MKEENVEKIKEQLQTEFSGHMKKQTSISEKKAKLDDRKMKIVKMIEHKSQRLEELTSLIAQNHDQFKSAEPEALAALSSQRVSLSKEQAEIESQLSDLVDRVLPVIETDLLAVKAENEEVVLSFLLQRHKSYNDEVLALVIDVLEPKILAWKEFVFDLVEKFKLETPGTDTYRRRFGSIEFYNPVIEAAVDKLGIHPLRVAAENYRNTKRLAGEPTGEPVAAQKKKA